ncbi:Uncharacterised protein [Bordetella pertussis]|nr:Uncharacterised protein [Bordetella pertussis]
MSESCVFGIRPAAIAAKGGAMAVRANIPLWHRRPPSVQRLMSYIRYKRC